MNKRILGLDTGTNSLGWAVVEKHQDGTYQLIDKGSYIFQEGVKIEKGIEKSRAAERREKRSSRRKYFRLRLRKIETLKVLIKNELCPPLSKEELNLWHTRKQYPINEAFLEWQRTDEAALANPYYYRYRCLTEELDFTSEADRFVLGRALYHLAQRRGFLSNRLDSTPENESGKVKESISELSKQMKEAGCEYLGEYFYKLYAEKGNTVRLRTRYTDRNEHYKKEFYAICKKQRLSAQMIKELERALYFQRPLKSQRHTVGKCILEPDKMRCAISHPAYERFRMLQFINNIKVQTDEREGLRHLTAKEIAEIEPLFYRVSKSNFDFEDIAKKLAGKNNYQSIKEKGEKAYKFNYDMLQGVAGCPTIAQLRQVFGENYREAMVACFAPDVRTADEAEDTIWNALSFFDDEEKLKAFGMNKLHLDADAATKFAAIRLAKDFAALSLKAIRKILPFLEMGISYYFAAMFAKAEGLRNDKDAVLDILGELEFFGNHVTCIRNILVHEYNISFEVLNEHFNLAEINRQRETHDFGKIQIHTARQKVKQWIPDIDSSTLWALGYLYAKRKEIFGNEASEDDVYSIFTDIEAKMRLDKHTIPEIIHRELVSRGLITEDTKLYDPSVIETYPDAKFNEEAQAVQLGSPKTNAIRNPMAMRSLHKVRTVVNALLRQGIIDQNTEIHIEYARELNDANKRQAIAKRNKDLEAKRKKAADEIKQELGIVATDDDIRKYLLWEEQEHVCLYTGQEIALSDFIGANPKYDIEHTIPRSVGGDSTMENLTLCDSWYNREVKKNQIPTACPNYDTTWTAPNGKVLTPILPRLEKWQKKVEELNAEIHKIRTSAASTKDIKDGQIKKKHGKKMERDYLNDKCRRFTMMEVPEGFSLRQAAGIGLVSKYAGLYLKSLFPKERRHEQLRVVKGTLTATFRKLWGIQDEWEKKSRDNHIHHCIDAITIACIGSNEISQMGAYYYDDERGKQPQFRKPWPTFTEDIKRIENEVLVVHDTPDHLPMIHEQRFVNTPTGKHEVKGHSARASLHQDSYYGAINRNGETKYVIRRALDANFKDSDIKNIVDDTVKAIVEAAAKEHKNIQNALKNGPIYMNKEKGIEIKRVRCYASNVTRPLNIRQQRDASRHDYKRQFHVANDSNYALVIYEGMVGKRMKRDFELINNLDAARFFNADRNDWPTIAPATKNDLPIRYQLKIGTQVLLMDKCETTLNFENTAELKKRLYKVVGLSILNVGNSSYGRIVLRFHQEARNATDIKYIDGEYQVAEPFREGVRMLHTQFHALVEGVDFKLDALGHIKPLKH